MDKEQKIKEKKIQTITNHLLRCDKTAEDVFNDVFWGKEGMTLTEAMNKCSDTAEASQVSLYGTMFSKEDVGYWCEHIDAPASVYALTLPKIVSMSDIERDLKRYLNKQWKDLAYNEKLDVLYEYGLSVKGGEESSKYIIKRQIHRTRDNKLTDGLVVIASERLDKEWINTPMASFEAKVFTSDGGLSRDLTSMSRYS